MTTQKVAVLHTSFVFVSVEPIINELIAELIPNAEVLHFVDSDVLATVMREGEISASSTERMVHLAEAAQSAGADIIFSACSSLGPALDVAAARVKTPIVKIDEAMAHQAAASAQRVGVLATVPTTLDPTGDLILKSAAEQGREITVAKQLAEGAFEVLMGGDRERHDALVIAAAEQLATQVDTIVLAQASMSRLRDRLEEVTGLPVLSSPRAGVADLANRTHALLNV